MFFLGCGLLRARVADKATGQAGRCARPFAFLGMGSEALVAVRTALG
jgi:transposase